MSFRSTAPLLAGASLLLTCIAANAQVPVQIPPPVAPSSSISIAQGTWAWQRTDYSDGSTVAPSNPSDYTVTFRTDGPAVFRADCNTGSAS